MMDDSIVVSDQLNLNSVYPSLLTHYKEKNISLPVDMIENRFKHLGIEDLLQPTDFELKNGFPFKYNQAIDEAILILHYFIMQKHQHPDAKIKIYCIHEPLKEEEMNLSFWRSSKAGLFLDCHSVINNLFRDNCKISRMFLFRDEAHLTQLEQDAFGVMFEQKLINIDVGIIFKNRITKNTDHLKNTLLVEFNYGSTTVYALLQDNTTSDTLPYQGNDLHCKWLSNESDEIKHIKEIFNYTKINLSEFTPNNQKDYIYEFSRHEDWKRTLSQIYSNLDPSKRVFGKKLLNRLNSLFKESKEIFDCLNQIVEDPRPEFYAVDSTSVKNSLKIHDVDPTYRNWMRSIMNRVLEKNGRLERVYILDDRFNEKKDEEFIYLKNTAKLYNDFINNSFSELNNSVWKIIICNGLESSTEFRTESQEVYNSQIKLFVITTAFINDLFNDNKSSHLLTKYSNVAKYLGISNNGQYTKSKRELIVLDFLISNQFTFGFPEKASNATNPHTPPQFALKDLANSDYHNKYNKFKLDFDRIKSISVEIARDSNGCFIEPDSLKSITKKLEDNIQSLESQLLSIASTASLSTPPDTQPSFKENIPKIKSALESAAKRLK